MDKNYQPFNDDVMLWKIDDIEDVNGRQFFQEIHTLLNNPKCNPYMQLQRWRALGPKLIKWVRLCSESNKACTKQLSRISDESESNKYKRWTPGEEESLVEMVCYGENSIIELSTIFGRTPSAIKTKLSQLVGLKRISQDVAGKFIGTIDGKHIEGDIDGTVTKK